MYELKNIGKVFTSKFVGTGPSSYKKRIYCAAVSQRLGHTDLYVTYECYCRVGNSPVCIFLPKMFVLFQSSSIMLQYVTL